MASNPDQFLAALIGTTGLQNNIMQGAQTHNANLQQSQAQTQLMQQQVADKQREAEMARQYDTDVLSALSAPPERMASEIFRLGAKYPAQAEALRKSWTIKDNDQRTSDLRLFGELEAALRSGRVDLAVKAAEARLAAEKAAGGDTSDELRLIDALKSGDKDAIAATRLTALANIAAATGQEEFAKAYKAVDESAGDKQFTLGPGGRRYDAQGNLIASAPFAPRPVSVGEGETVIEYNPNAEGGDQGTGGGDIVSRMLPITIGTESGGREYGPDGSRLTSPKGAKGVMQVMPSTGRDPGYGITPSDGTPAEDARLGRDYLTKMYELYNDPAKAWAAYNAGPGAVDKAVENKGANWLQAMPAETRKYVARNMSQLQKSGATGSGTRVIAQGRPKQGYQLLTPEENQSLGLDPNVRYQRGPDGQIAALGGQSKAQLKPVPAPIFTGYSENRKSLRKIDQTLKDLAAYPDGVGLVIGNTPDWLAQRYDPKGVNVRAGVADIGSLKIHDRSGAAVTAAETPRLLPFIPKASDTAETAIKKLELFKKEVEAINADIDAQYSEEQGFRPIATPDSQPAPVRVRSVQEAMKLPKGTIFMTPPSKEFPNGQRKVR